MRYKIKPPTWGYFAESSGRFDRPVSALRKSVAAIRSDIAVVLIAGTEASGRSKADLDEALGDPMWDYAHIGSDNKGASECWITWSQRVLEPVGKAYAVKLTDQTWTRSKEYGGKQAPYVHALVQVLQVVKRPHRRPIAVIAVHMPLDNTPLRERVWLDAAGGLRALVAQVREEHPNVEVVITGDFNRNARQDPERALVEAQITKPLGLTHCWTKPPKTGGTHGPRSLLDWYCLPKRMFRKVFLLPDDSSSDHRPFAIKVKFRLLPVAARK